MSHHEDCFYAAVSVLAAHGRVKQRLIKAYEEHLAQIDHDELPVPVQESFAELRSNMHRVTPANGESPVCASVRKMSKIEADECAEAIVALLRNVVRYGGGESKALTIDSAAADLPPPFLVKTS